MMPFYKLSPTSGKHSYVGEGILRSLGVSFDSKKRINYFFENGEGRNWDKVEYFERLVERAKEGGAHLQEVSDGPVTWVVIRNADSSFFWLFDERSLRIFNLSCVPRGPSPKTTKKRSGILGRLGRLLRAVA
jgi:hypothetical protein